MIEHKRVFVTGGAGFIGSTVVSSLIDRNEVIAFDNLSRNTLKDLPELLNHPNFTLIEGDVLDSASVAAAMKDADVVVHAAGIAGIDTVIKNPVNTMRVNMIGTGNVVEGAKANRVGDRIIDLSTSEVCGAVAFRSSESDVTVAPIDLRYSKFSASIPVRQLSLSDALEAWLCHAQPLLQALRAGRESPPRPKDRRTGHYSRALRREAASYGVAHED